MCGHAAQSTHDHSYHRDAEALVEQALPKPITKPCPQCSTPVQENFVFCPLCGAELLIACPECHRAVESSWTHCAYCGTELTTTG